MYFWNKKRRKMNQKIYIKSVLFFLIFLCISMLFMNLFLFISSWHLHEAIWQKHGWKWRWRQAAPTESFELSEIITNTGKRNKV